jgi:hypothetical protein
MLNQHPLPKIIMKNILYLFFVGMLGCAILPKPQADEPSLQIDCAACKENHTQMTMRFDNKEAIIDVKSSSRGGPFGGSFTIKQSNGYWPEQIIIRIHQPALEGFSARAGNRDFRYERDHDRNVWRFEQWQNGKQLDPIEIEIPQKIVKYSSHTIEIWWIDWYKL